MNLGAEMRKKNLYAYAMELISHGDLIFVLNDCLYRVTAEYM
jgi:hypothetical protein